VTTRRFIERGPLSSEERVRIALLGNGSRAFDKGIDPIDGSFIAIARLVLLPVLPSRDPRRTLIEIWVSPRETRWVEFVDDEPAPTVIAEEPELSIDIDVDGD
jgi:hypothetical protein